MYNSMVLISTFLSRSKPVTKFKGYYNKMANATKKKSVCIICGAFEELLNNMLATYLNIMKHYNEIKRCLLSLYQKKL